MNRKQIEALNAAGDALKGLGLGKVRLSYHPPETLIPRDTWSLWIEDQPGLCIGTGDTPAIALERALQLAARDVPQAA